MKRFHFYALAVAVLLPLVAYGAATPKEAVGFWGEVTGRVKSAQANGLSFSLTVSKATPDSQSTAKNPAGMVGKVITLGTRMPKNKSGEPTPNVDDVAYIKSLKVGDAITIKVFALLNAPTVLRMRAPGTPAATQPVKQHGD